MNNEQTSYLEQIALGMVIEKRSNNIPFNTLEQEIEHILEQLKELREHRSLQQDYYGIYSSSLLSIDSYDSEKQNSLYVANIWSSGNQEARVQELIYKLQFLLNIHERSSSGTVYWAGGYS